MLKYQSQKIALGYFAVAMALFVIQVLMGLLIGYIYLYPNTLAEILPFNILRMLHTNSLIVWLITGFFGIAYYMIPEEAEREIESPMLAWVQLAILVVGTLGAVLTYVFDFAHGNWLFGMQGREFLEQPLWVKVGIVVAALIFLCQRAAAGPVGAGAVLPVRLLQPVQPGAGQDVLVVGGAPVGGRRLGADHGGRAGLPDAEAHRR